MNMILTRSLKAWAISGGAPPDASDETFERFVRRALVAGTMTPEGFLGHVEPKLIDFEPERRAELVAEVTEAIGLLRLEEEVAAGKKEMLADLKRDLAEVEDADHAVGFDVGDSLRNWAWAHYELSSTDVAKDSLVSRLALIALKEGELLADDYASMVAGENQKAASIVAEIVKQALQEYEQGDETEGAARAVAKAVARDLA